MLSLEDVTEHIAGFYGLVWELFFKFIGFVFVEVAVDL